MSAVGGRADVARRWLELPLIAEGVEKVFRGVWGERLIRQQTQRRNNDSNIVPPNFDCCGNTILELCSPTFSTPSAISGHSSASSQSAWRKSETGLAGLPFRHANAAKAFEDAFKAWTQPGMAVAKFFNCVSLPAGQFHVLAENYAGVIHAAKHGKRRR